MEMDVRREDGVIVLQPQAKTINSSISKEFQQQVQVEAGEEAAAVVVNLSEVEFMDSSGVGAIVALLKSFRGQRDFALCATTAPVQSLLELTRVDRFFQIFESEAAAADALSSNGASE